MRPPLTQKNCPKYCEEELFSYYLRGYPIAGVSQCWGIPTLRFGLGVLRFCLYHSPCDGGVL